MRKMFQALVGLCVALAVGSAAAQAAFPNKPVKIVVPFTAGGLADVLARGLAEELGKVWKQPVVVENRPGAGTMIAGEYTAKSAPDGYTLLLANDATLSSNQYIYNKVPYDPVNGFTPIINIANSPITLVAARNFAVKDVKELVAYATKNPDKVNYGTFGVGSTAHVDAHSFMAITNTKLNHIPYKGVSEVMVALAGDYVQIAFTGVPPAIAFARDGKVRMLAISGARRSPLFPDVPTFAEAGFGEFSAAPWFGLVGAAGMPRPLVDKIATDVSKIIVQPAFQKSYITGVGLELLNEGPEQYAAFLARDRAGYAVKMKRLGIKLD
jgi:tripartite-type tricarboxylate transporter receptor subunit TctC